MHNTRWSIRVTPHWLISRCSAAGGAGLAGAPCGVSNLGMAAFAQAVAGLRHPASAAPGPNGLHPDGLPVLIWKHEVQNFVTININNVISLTALQSDYNIYNSTNHLLACRVLLGRPSSGRRCNRWWWPASLSALTLPAGKRTSSCWYYYWYRVIYC